MARVNNLSNFLTDVASAIKTKKGSETAIPAANFDTEILALPSQGVYQTKVITINENGQTVITPDSGYDAMDGVQVTTLVPEKQLQTKSYEFTTNQTIELTPDTGYDGFDSVILTINVPGQQINNQDKTITENGTYTADSGYTGLGTVNVNVSGGGDAPVKLFTTEQEMEADPNPEEGDLAVVYGSSLTNWDGTTPIASLTFPSTVVLSTAYTGDAWIYGNGYGPSSRIQLNGSINSSGMNIVIDMMSDYKNIEYTSSDGITYTKTSGDDVVTFSDTPIQFDMYEWDVICGNFMKIGGKYFDGLYEYKQKGQYGIPYNFRIENNTLLYDIIPFDVPSFAKSIGVNTKSGTLIIMKRDENGDFIGYYSNNSSGQSIVKYNGRLYYANRYGANCSYTDLSTGETTSLTNGQQVTVGSITTYIMLDTEMEDNDKLVYFIPSGGWEYNVYIDTYTLLQPSGGFRYPSYYFADTQLDATADYVYEKTFYGKNGVENGTLTTNISSTFDDKNAEVYSKIMQAYDNMSPMILTDDNKEISKSIKLIPVKSNGEPLLDTSNVTNMSYMFSGCTSLTTISLLDTSNATNMNNMLNGCTNLTTIPQLNTSKVTDMGYMFTNCTSLTAISLLDTSNVTNMYRMFDNCTSLTTISLLDTSNVTNMYRMFTNCTSLTTIPLLDTSNVTNMSYMFSGCTSLTTIPLLDTSNVTNMYYMFQNCTSLQEIDLSGGTINSSASHNGIFYNVPTTCVIYVKDQASKTLLESWDNTHTYIIKTI